MNWFVSAAFVMTWSSGFIGAKLGTESASAVTVLMWRFVPLAIVLLAAISLWRASREHLTSRVACREVVIGLLSQSGYLLTVYYAIQLGVSSGTTALIDAAQPLVAGALAGPILGVCVSRRQWLGLVIGALGVLVVTHGDAMPGAGTPRWAYAVPFLGMLTLVAATFLDRRSTTSIKPLTALTIHCTSSAVLFSLIAVATGDVVPPSALSFWISTVWLIVFSTFGGYGCYWLVLRRDGVTRINSLMFLMAPTTIVWGAIMFGEPFGWQTVIGLAICVVAVVTVRAPAQDPRRAGTAYSVITRPQMSRRPGSGTCAVRRT